MRAETTITVEELASRWGLSKRTIHRMIKAGTIFRCNNERGAPFYLAYVLRYEERQREIQDILRLQRWHRWGPHGGPDIVYECAGQPDSAGDYMLVWAAIPQWTKIMVKRWYYRRENNPPHQP